MQKFLPFLALLLVAALAYVRFAPSNVARWHNDPEAAADPGRSGVLRSHGMALAPAAALTRFDAVARGAPRVRHLAGSVETGQITYVARSKWFGFPDYVTVKAVVAEGGSRLVILSRLRFGRSDYGVNAARLTGWLQRLDPAQN